LDFTNQTIQFLYAAIKRASVSPDNINVGDYIVITGATDDTIGIIKKISAISNTAADITLKTSSGTRTLQISDKNYIHIIQRADMLDMRKHTDYERDLEDVDKGTHKLTEKDQRPALGPDIKSDKSELPTSKISLVMKKQKTSVHEKKGPE